MDKLVNLSVLRNPLNWISIGAMMAIVALGAFVVYSHFNAAPKDGDIPASGNLQEEV